MIGGPGTQAQDEQIYTVGFPERPGALHDFLQIIGGQDVNISLFHYRGQGGDIGRVLIGLENAGHEDYIKKLEHSSYDIQPADSKAITTFLQA